MDGWVKLFMLPRCVLASPVRGGCTHWRNTVKLMKSRIRRWRAGDLCALWADMMEDEDKQARSRKKSKADLLEEFRRANAKWAHGAAEDGQYRKALLTLSSADMADATSEVVDTMLVKHPQSLAPLIPPSPTPPSPTISETCVLKALKSFPSGSAPGPSNLWANHLKEAVQCPSLDRSAHATRALTRVIQLLCTDHCPPYIIPHLCVATLLTTKKKGGGLRPIAVGEVLRRLTFKCLSHLARSEAIETLTPLQLEVGVRVGCEVIVHAVNSVHRDANTPPREQWTLLLDFSNAFNSIDRHSMFLEVRACIPSLAAWIECCYGARPILHLGKRSILSCCGVQQGDPLGPLGFALTLQPIVEKIKAATPGLKINAWYLDDGTLCGSPCDLATALRIIEEDSPPCGLHLNRAKSLLYVPANCSLSPNPLPSDILVTMWGFTFLGFPVGPATFCEDFVRQRVGKIKDCLSKLPDLEDSQIEMSLLRSCLALPKVSFSLRTCPPNHIIQAMAAFDDTMHNALSELVGSPLTEWAWMKALPPSSRVELNIRRAFLHAPTAYVRSRTQTSALAAEICGGVPVPLDDLSGSIAALADAANRPDWSCLEEIDVPQWQGPLSHTVDEAAFNRLLNTSPSCSRFRALALSSLPHAGDWLNVIPFPALGLHLQDKEFRLCLCYWLGLRMFADGSICSICQEAADPFGDHHVGCGGNGDWIFRHDSIRDALFSVAQSAALALQEASSLIAISSSRPADIYLPIWKRDQPAVLDLTVISTMQQLTQASAASTPGYALHMEEERKMAAHAEACRSVGLHFVPIVAETLGGWSELAIDTIKSIGHLQGQRQGIPPPDSIRHHFQRLAISVWKGNATLWICRQPTRPVAVDGIV